MIEFPDQFRLRFPSGQPVAGAWVVPAFAQEYLGLDADALWEDLVRMPTLGDDERLNGRAAWLRGSHPALRMRGHPIRRNKIWCQYREDFLAGRYRRYRYPGWQWRVLRATCAIEEMPASFQTLVDRLNRFYEQAEGSNFNHFIVTCYGHGGDGIGMHRDQVADFAPNSLFGIIKLGAPRPFAFSEKGEMPFFCEPLEAGTGIFVRCKSEHEDANARVLHGVPAVAKAGCSGSIVARVIETTIPFEEVDRRSQKG